MTNKPIERLRTWEMSLDGTGGEQVISKINELVDAFNSLTASKGEECVVCEGRTKGIENGDIIKLCKNHLFDYPKFVIDTAPTPANTPERLEDWEKEFDDKFGNLWTTKPQEDKAFYENKYEHTNRRVKDFISSLLASNQASLVERIKGMRKEGCEHDQDGACYAGKYENNLCGASYNQALDDVLTLLTELQKNG